MKLIPLTKGYSAKVDDADFDYLNQFSWHHTKTGYAMRRDFKAESKERPHGICRYMHREILRARKGRTVDHKNGDGLDNRRENLRLCTQAQNIWNMRKKTGYTASRYKGVALDKRRGHWVVRITCNKRETWVGSFEKEHHAPMAYDMTALALFGKFARLNFVPVNSGVQTVNP